jgi:hypothetical protein
MPPCNRRAFARALAVVALSLGVAREASVARAQGAAESSDLDLSVRSAAMADHRAARD